MREIEIKQEEQTQVELEPQSEYMNVSNKYLSYLKQKELSKRSTSPPSTPPPLPPTSPPQSRSPSPVNTSLVMPQSPFKPTNDKLVSKIISNPTTITTTTLTTTTTTISSTIGNNNPSSSTESSRLMSTNSSLNQAPIKLNKSEFRYLNNNASVNHSDRSATTLSGKSLSSLSQSNNNLNFNNRVMLSHIPDSVDVVQFHYEGQRRVVVPGYMTSADILRNMLLNSNKESTNGIDCLDPSKAPIIIQRQTTNMSLKEKLLLQNQNQNQNGYEYQPSQKPPMPPQFNYQPVQLMQPIQQIKDKQIDNDDDLDKKFNRSRTRSMSGIVTLDLGSTQNTQIIDIDLDYESKPVQEPPPILEPPTPIVLPSPIVIENHYAVTNSREIKPSIRINQLITNSSTPVNGLSNSRRNGSHLSYHRQSVTGSFDPNDFDSFDEDECNSYRTENVSIRQRKQHIQEKAHIPIESMDKIRESAIMQQKLDEYREKQQANLVQFDPDDFDSFNEEEDEVDTKTLPVIQLENKQEYSEPQIDSKEQRQSEFLVNRNKLEAMFKKSDIYAQKTDIQPKIIPLEPNKQEIIQQEPIKTEDLNKIEPAITFTDSNHYSNKQSNFFRSALDRISNRSSKSKGSKNRSSSVPLRTLISSNLEISTDKQCEQPKKQPPQPQQRSKLAEAPVSPTKKSQTLENQVLPNMKTLQLMNKMQSEFDEKQKRRKIRRDQKIQEEKLPPKSPKSSSTDRKFLSSIMNTLFSSSNNINDSTSSSNNESKSTLQKNEAKRLSLRKLKAKDKAKKKPDSQSGDEFPMTSNTSLNINRNYEEDEEKIIITQNFPRSSSFDTGSLSKLTSVQFQPQSIGAASINSRFGKIKNETDKPKDENNKENLMKQLKAELDEEIKDRRMIELKHNIINGTCNNSTGGSTSSGSSCQSSLSLNRQSLKDRQESESNQNRKIRSKSVTFLDEISTDDEVISMENQPQLSNYPQNTMNLQYSTPQPQHRLTTYQQVNEDNNFFTPSSSRKTKTNVKTGDVRMMCGALTGVGPIRSIMKKSATDLSLTLNTPSTSSSYETNHVINNNHLPNVGLNEFNSYEINNYRKQINPRLMKSETNPQITKRRDLMQSDL